MESVEPSTTVYTTLNVERMDQGEMATRNIAAAGTSLVGLSEEDRTAD